MIQYQTTTLSSGKKDGFYEVLQECKAAFEENHINILGEGYQEIVSDDTLWEDYKTQMLKGVDPDEVDQLDQLLENSRLSTLQESLSGITPISSLSVPTIRKLWPRMAMKNALPTEVVKLPKFSISYLLPFLIKDGVKHYLPEAIMAGGTGDALVEGQPLYDGEILIADFDPGAGVVDGAGKGFKLLETLPGGAVASSALGDSVDPDFWLTGILIETTDTQGTPVVAVEAITNLRIGTGLNGDIYYEVSKYAQYDIDNAVAPATVVAGAVMSKDILIGRLDRDKGTLTLACTGGLVKGVTIKGKLSAEFNLHTESVSFDIKTRDVTIGTGVHLNAPLPIEFLKDVMAMYNVDGAAKIVDIMTNVLALKLDRECSEFIKEAFIRDSKYTGQFDCRPYAQFAGTPKQWREMLKDTIDHHCQKLKQDNMYQGGKFVIVGNDLDIALIPNVSWTFTGTTAERSGVEVDYKLGATTGVHNYEIIGTTSFTQGSLFIFYVSSQDEQMTYKYFPYSFNVEKGYQDPNYAYVPSLMMAKRHKLEVFKDAIIKIDILNNSGDMNFGT